MGFPVRLSIIIFIGFIIILVIIGSVASLLSLSPNKNITESNLSKRVYEYNYNNIKFSRLDNNKNINYNFSLY
jgi:ABC-type transport system involved in multi-copper enzyme maturation permease subunit